MERNRTDDTGLATGMNERLEHSLERLAFSGSCRLSDVERVRLQLYREGHARVDRLIIGGGWAGKVAYSSLPRRDAQDLGHVSTLLITGNTDPWRARTGLMGQTGRDLPPAARPDGQSLDEWILCRHFSEHISQICRRDIEDSTLVASITSPIERVEHQYRGCFQVRVEEQGVVYHIFADRIDICTGPGAARTLTPCNDAREVLERLGKISCGDRFFGDTNVRNKRIAVFGGGATAAWAAEHAIRHGAVEVVWIARPMDNSQSAGNSVEIDVRGVRRALRTLLNKRNQGAQFALLEDLSVIAPAFMHALKDRNIDPEASSSFLDSRVKLFVTDLNTATFHVCENLGAWFVTNEGRYQAFDKLFVCIGEDGERPGSAAQLLAYESQLEPMWRENHFAGLQSDDGRIRVLGAASVTAQLLQRLPADVLKSCLDDLRYLVATSGGPRRSAVSAVPVWFNGILRANGVDL